MIKRGRRDAADRGARCGDPGSVAGGSPESRPPPPWWPARGPRFDPPAPTRPSRRLPGAARRRRAGPVAGRDPRMNRVDTSVPAVVLGLHYGGVGVARSLGRLGVPVYGVDYDARAPGVAC